MKFIVISDFQKCNDPAQIEELFELGLFRFHIKEEKVEAVEFIQKLPIRFRNKVSFHGGNDLGVSSHGSQYEFAISESCHSILEMVESNRKYCFLSPIYDSISKDGYLSKFNLKELKSGLEKKRNSQVFALGGVSDSNISELKNLGFDGVALKGFLWNKGRDPIEQFKKIIKH